MKHHCHCGFKKHRDLSKGKRLGALGVTFMVLHLLYHVAECLILPAVFMALSNHHDDTAVAVSEAEIISEQINLDEATASEKSLILTNLRSQPHLYTNFFETLY